MKILGKYKDYYDWVVSIYGIDPIMIYDRRFDYIERPDEFTQDEHKTISVYIAGESYVVHFYKGEWFHTADDLALLDDKLKKDNKETLFQRRRWQLHSIKSKEYYEEIFKNSRIKTTLNMKFRSPIVISTIHGNRAIWTVEDKSRGDSHYTSVILEDYGFAKWYTAEEMFTKIYSFISYLKDHPEIQNNQSNNEKIQSNGFDAQTSFRPNMK